MSQCNSGFKFKVCVGFLRDSPALHGIGAHRDLKGGATGSFVAQGQHTLLTKRKDISWSCKILSFAHEEHLHGEQQHTMADSWEKEEEPKMSLHCTLLLKKKKGNLPTAP